MDYGFSEGYNYNFQSGLILVRYYFYKYDKLSNLLIFNKNYSCFPKCYRKCDINFLYS